MLIEAYAIASASFLVGRFVYHRWFNDPPVRRIPKQEVTIPIVEPGLPIPLIYGRVRVRTPVLAGVAMPTFGSLTYQMNQVFTVGIPFDGGNSTNRIHGMWAGNRKAIWTVIGTHNGDGGPETPISVINGAQDGSPLGSGALEFLSGKPTQVVAQDGATSADAVTNLGRYMLRPYGRPQGDANIGGFGQTVPVVSSRRGRLTVFLHAFTIGQQWQIGRSPNLPAYSFEVSSYDTNHPRLGTFSRVGSDSNPINVLHDLLRSKMGKLGIPDSRIDMASFQAAQYVLHTETHGYSNVIDSVAEADEHMEDILRQIDGCIDEDPTDGKIKIKLIRNDYDPTEIPHITKDNCEALITGAASGWTNTINSVQVIYTNREKDYDDDSERDFNQAIAHGGDANDLVLHFPGCTSAAMAKSLAGRELSFRSRPILRFRAICDRSQYTRMRGDAVKVTMKKPNIPGLVFRVANVGRGTLEDGKVALDLVLDNFYVHRDQVPEPTWRDLPRPPVFSGGIT